DRPHLPDRFRLRRHHVQHDPRRDELRDVLEREVERGPHAAAQRELLRRRRRGRAVQDAHRAAVAGQRASRPSLLLDQIRGFDFATEAMMPIPSRARQPMAMYSGLACIRYAAMATAAMPSRNAADTRFQRTPVGAGAAGCANADAAISSTAIVMKIIFLFTRILLLLCFSNVLPRRWHR